MKESRFENFEGVIIARTPRRMTALLEYFGRVGLEWDPTAQNLGILSAVEAFSHWEAPDNEAVPVIRLTKTYVAILTPEVATSFNWTTVRII